MTQKQRVANAAAYVLHALPYRETSLIVELFTRSHGRIGAVAKGAKRPRSALRGVLMEFQPLAASWSGGGELKTLTHAEWKGGQPMLAGRALLLGYYLNELLLNLLPREDAHVELFDAYARSIAELGAGGAAAPGLRRFERILLAELGYLPLLTETAEGGVALDPAGEYVFVPDRGALPAAGQSAHLVRYRGAVLNAIAADDYSDPAVLQQGRQLMRTLIDQVLDGRMLNSRRIFFEMQEP
ncbi:MAG: DNA repair protein RecO [Rhodocyclaceae bacterium]|nr:DNA repair protein RecO [Rhodocyclaceae bacterium]